jgi:hypothetical protein
MNAKFEDTAKRLGTEAAQRLDVEATARAVVERLREPEARPAWVQPAWLRVAAVLLVLAGGGLVLRQVRGPRAVHAAHFVTDDLTDLSADQLLEVLNTLDETLDSVGTPPPESGLDDLDAQQLRTVLRSLEG